MNLSPNRYFDCMNLLYLMLIASFKGKKNQGKNAIRMNKNWTVCTMRKWGNYSYKILVFKNENKQHTRYVEMGEPLY